MIFIVALDPASIEWAGQQGELGYDHLSGVLEGLLQNCFIAETSSWRIGEELKHAVRAVEETGTRKRVSAILETLTTRGRFFESIDDSAFRWDASLGEVLAAQFDHPELDMIVTETTPKGSGSVEIMKLAQYNQSNFARERSKYACSISFASATLSASELLDGYFRKLVSIGDKLVMIDPVIGRNFGGNFAESLKHWIAFLENLNKRLHWIIHTEDAQCHSIRNFLQDKLSEDVTIEVIGHAGDRLPHERYFRCAGICIDIGRGIDLFDRDGRIRDVRLGLGDDNQITKQYPHLL